MVGREAAAARAARLVLARALPPLGFITIFPEDLDPLGGILERGKRCKSSA